MAEGSGEPYLSSTEDGLWLSWLEPVASDGGDEADGGDERGRMWALRLASVEEDRLGPMRTVVERDDFFVNWADFPSVVGLDDGRLVAHWLQRGGEGTYDYGVRVAWSSDGGESWSEPWTPHEDGTPTEHGFVSLMPGAGEGVGLVWLDGRAYVERGGVAETEEMSLRFRTASGPGTAGPETLIDGRVCDCCQTGAARTTDGWVVVYRDRSEDEIRDIYSTRWVDGEWTVGRPVHRDGWHIAACPVNGPSVAAAGDRVVVAWFTAAGDVPRVLAAFSDDQGTTFSEPIHVDGGSPVGRVDVLLDGDHALVSWMESGDESAELRLRRVAADRTAEAPRLVAAMSGARAAGFPRMERDGADLVFAWTDASDDATRVRLARLASVFDEENE
ncbi:MAG: glycoside hydrolase [Gemmatimonadetes bacterium]|nr:glycoside hydrolase [Gemmatimonadota bacterium]NNF38367.1 exo-alpha-sialidase [Gemmatimonadota bacterium]NNK63798.1 exo-alpha-sialidase [Gemmatimonadota bacterium]